MLHDAAPRGITEATLNANGVSAATIAGLVRAGLATATPQRMRAGGRMIEVVLVRITEARAPRPTPMQLSRSDQPDQTREEAMRHFSFATATAALLLWALAFPAGAQAAEIVVLAAGAVQEPFEAVVHAFEHDTGNKVAATFGSVGAIQNKLKAGANADVVILSTPLVAAAEKDGTARAGSRAVVGRAEIGVAVREGTAAPDISTADAFKKTLLATKSVSFTDPAGGGTAAVFVAGLLDRLGVADAIKGKSLKFNTGREVIAAVVKGDAEIGIGFTSEFIPVKGVKVVGALPREIEFVNEYSAYIPVTSAAADSAQALLAYLARPASRDIFRAAGVGM